MSNAKVAGERRASLTPRAQDDWEAFRIPWLRHVGTQLATRCPRFSIRLGNWESRLLAERLDDISITRPIYIAGLARSGSTVVLETVAAHRGVATQRYRDFPCLFTPYWWNQYLDRCPRKTAPPKPRVHADGIVVSPESPEALEEPLWMAFFPQAHRPDSPLVLDGTTEQPDFAQFYRNHVRKLLLVRGGARYACKGNYHVARLEYLLQIFPDARLVIPIRRPRDHVASLLKQHRLLAAGERRHPRALRQMQATGHFEFGLDRRAMHLGDVATVASIRDLWQRGEEVRGWAGYWSHVHGFLAQRLAAKAALRRATLVVRYEDLCVQPHAMLASLADHCDLPGDDALRKSQASRLHAPTYYRPEFSVAEEAAIEEETADVAAQFYDDHHSVSASYPIVSQSAKWRRAAA